MNRRDTLKAIGLTSLSATMLLDACKTGTKKEEVTTAAGTADEQGKQPWEIERDKKLLADKFFTTHEMATINVLVDIIIPKDAHSGSATDAKVPDFIEFIVKDIPEHQVPLRGGLKWLDLKCLADYGQPFADCRPAQQLEMVTAIAYPLKAKPQMQPGVIFFNRMRDLTATGFFTSKIGIKDIGYMGNAPGKWEGVPADVLKQYGFTSGEIA